MSKSEPLDGRSQAAPTRTECDPKHTPGPWRAEQPGATWQINSDAGPIALGVERRDFRQRPSKYHPEETAANARLIAAAPDLLDACQEIERWWLQSEMSKHAGAPVGMFMIREAISKAKGSGSEYDSRASSELGRSTPENSR